MHTKTEMAEMCKKHMNKYVLVHTTDGLQYDGIVESIDDEYVYLAVPVGNTDLIPPQTRVFPGYYGYGGYPYGPGAYGGYSYGYPGYGYGYGGRFRRLALPLAALAAISLLPYF